MSILATIIPERAPALHQIPVECLFGEDNLALDAGGVKQVNSIFHSCCKPHMLNIKALCIRRDGDEIAITNPILQTPQGLLWNEKQGSSADRPFNRLHSPKVRSHFLAEDRGPDVSS